MIDSLTIVIPYSGPFISGGQIIVCDRDGNVERETNRPLIVEGGSWSEKTDIRMIPSGLRINGNPPKWLQGHNLVGTDDLHSLVMAWAPQVLTVAGIADFELLRNLQTRNYAVNRVDCTYMFTLPPGVSPAAWIEAAKLQATGKYQKSEGKHTTLYIGKHSTYSTVKIYSKIDEIKDNQLKISDEEIKEKAVCWLKDKLRIEVTYRKPALKDLGLHHQKYSSLYIYGLFVRKMMGVNIMANVNLNSDEIELLEPRYRSVYQLWHDGYNVFDLYSRPTAYRHAKYFRENYGINILQKRGDKVVQRIPLVEILAAKPAQVPGWLQDTCFQVAA